jgi:hypothetical protein
MKARCPAMIMLLALCTMMHAGCAGKVVVTKVPESIAEGRQQSLDGVIYALPRTVVKASVPVDRTESTAGLCAKYTALFFPEAAKSDDFVKDKKVAFKIGTPTFSTFGEPDLSKLYYVMLSDNGPVDRTATLDYTEQGTLSGAQGGADNYMTEIILGGISAVTGIVTRVKYGYGGTYKKDVNKSCPESITSQKEKDIIVYEFFGKATGTEEVFYNYCQLGRADEKESIQNDVEKEIKDKNPLSPLSIALLEYKKILNLSERRQELIRQQGVSVSLQSLELMLKEIDTLVANRMRLFIGKKTKETWTPVFELRPITVNDPPLKLLSVHESCGIRLVQPLHAQDDPPDGFTAKDNCTSSGTKTLQARFALDGNEQMFQRVKSVYKEDGERSFRYLIPAASLVILEVVETKDQKEIVSAVKGGKAVIMVGQFGAEVSLPASTGGRSLNYVLKYYEATGALKSFGLTSKTAMQAAAVNSFSTSANAILDAKKKQEKDAADKADELNILERKRKILEEQTKIKDNCEKLGITCP